MVLEPLVAQGLVVTEVTVPFSAPLFWYTDRFGAPVVYGDAFTVRLANGERIAL